MPTKWSADLIAKMHLHGITRKALAAELRCTPEYVSMILNGHRSPSDAEKRFHAAFEALLRAREEADGEAHSTR